MASFALNADGTFTYTPATNFNGIDQFTYRASDGKLSSNLATVKITVGNPTGKIGGTVFADTNGNGKKDGSEKGASGWKLWIDKDKDGVLDKGEVSVSTDTSGHYNFANLSAGTYRIRYVSKSGWKRTTSKSYFDVKITAGGLSMSNNFGFQHG